MLITQLSLAILGMFMFSFQGVAAEVKCDDLLDHRDLLATFFNNGTTAKIYDFVARGGVDDHIQILSEPEMDELYEIFRSRLSLSEASSYDWNLEKNYNFIELRTNQWSSSVDPGCTTIVYQVVGECDECIVYTGKLQSEKYDKNGDLIVDYYYN